MARNLILGDPFEGSWCVYGRIIPFGGAPQHILAFYETVKDAEEAAKSLREKFDGQVSVRIFEYSYAKDEADIIKLACIDAIMAGVEYICG